MDTVTTYTTRAGIPTADEVLLLWGWLQQRPLCNMDDYGPKTYDDLWRVMRHEVSVGTVYHVVSTPTGPVGMFGLQTLPREVAHFHGLCFDAQIHGRGIALPTVFLAIDALRQRGIRKVNAEFFAHNGRVRGFFQKLGFHNEGYFREETKQGGKLVNVERMALFTRNLKGGA